MLQRCYISLVHASERKSVSPDLLDLAQRLGRWRRRKSDRQKVDAWTRPFRVSSSEKNLQWIDCSGFPHITRHLRDHPHTPTRRAARPESSGTPRPRDLRASSARTFARVAAPRGRSRAPSSPFSETRRHRDNRLASGKPSPRRPPPPRARISSRERPRVPREAALALARTPRNRLDARMTVGNRSSFATTTPSPRRASEAGSPSGSRTRTTRARAPSSRRGVRRGYVVPSPPEMRRGHIRPVFAATLARYDAATVATPSSARFPGASGPTAGFAKNAANRQRTLSFFNLARRPGDPGEPADHLHHPHLRLGHRLSASSESAAELYISSTAMRARRARRGGVHPTLRDAIPLAKPRARAISGGSRVSDQAFPWPARRGERSHWPARHAGPGISLFFFFRRETRGKNRCGAGPRGERLRAPE